MSRFVLIRDGRDGGERLVEESTVPTEADLHDVLTRHPALVPGTDLGLGRVAAVGYEVSLASGYADLVLIDDRGRVCIVEVKKEGNPDTRRVVAQLLDYAAALWGMSTDEFERDVLRPKLGTTDPRGLREFVLEELVHDADDPEEAAERALEELGETLRTGDFTLVLAAPSIPVGVQRVIEYLNARGSSVYGLEVSYFAGEVEAFVPRLVVRPSVAARIAGGDARGPTTPIDAETLVVSLPDATRDAVGEFLGTIGDSGAELDWKENRVRVRVRGDGGRKVVATVTPDQMWIALYGSAGFDGAHGARAAARMRELPAATVGKEFATVKLTVAPLEQVVAAIEVARSYVKDLVEDARTGRTAT